MDRNEALAALDAVRETDRRMAQRMRWPFYRHALFGVAEGALVAGLGMSGGTGTAVLAAGVVALLGLMSGDKERNGMFVSGFKGRRTRPLTWFMTGIVVGALALSLFVLRDLENGDMLAAGLGVVAAIVLTFASMQWERLYRAELLSDESQ